MTNPRPLRVLLLCNYRPHEAAMVSDHIFALHHFSRHQVFVHTTLVQNQGQLDEDIDLNMFDVVVVHYSIALAIDAYINHHTLLRLGAFEGLKVVFIQDEYRFVDSTAERLAKLGIDVLFTCIPEEGMDAVYPPERLPHLRKINTLTGFVPTALTQYRPKMLARRRYHISYRGRKYPAWHGRLGLEKWQISDAVAKAARSLGLKVNLSHKESQRAYGAAWVSLMQNSRAVLGVESGASVFDFTGEISAKVETMEALLRKRDAPYDSLRALYFANVEDQIPIAQLSPRVFEAIALRTACVLYEGSYSGVLEPWRHYLPLKKDLSNFAQIASFLKDDVRLAELIARAYAEIALNPKYSYRVFVNGFDDILSEECQARLSGAARHRPPAHERLRMELGVTGPADASPAKRDALAPETDFTALVSPTRFHVRYGFRPVSNPHGIGIAAPGLAGRVKSWAVYLPPSLKAFIKSIVR